MNSGSQSFTKIRDALEESNHADIANMLNLDEEARKMNRRPSLNSLGTVDSNDSDESRTRIGDRTASDARVTREVGSDLADLFKFSNSYGGVNPDVSPDGLVNIPTEGNSTVNVVPATKWRHKSHFCYKMDSYPRGCALIVNNTEFELYPDRRGAHNDHIRLEPLLKGLQFDVTIHKNKTRSEMISIIREFSKKEELKTVDCLMIVLMSHGAEGASEEDTEIIGVDGIGLKTREIVNYFNHDNCPAFVMKPKIFIFQACRGVLWDYGTPLPKDHYRTETDGQKINSTNRPVLIRSIADVFIAYAVPPGRLANRDIIKGTWFIQTIIDVFAEHACEHDLEDMLKMVDINLQKWNDIERLNFQAVSTTTIGWNKRLFFNPGLRLEENLESGDAGDGDLVATRNGPMRNENDETDFSMRRCFPSCTIQ